MQILKKYHYEVVLQANYGTGWEDVETFPANSSYSLSEADRKELNNLRKEYALHRYPVRTINRRTKNTTNH